MFYNSRVTQEMCTRSQIVQQANNIHFNNCIAESVNDKLRVLSAQNPLLPVWYFSEQEQKFLGGVAAEMNSMRSAYASDADTT